MTVLDSFPQDFAALDDAAMGEQLRAWLKERYGDNYESLGWLVGLATGTESSNE